jgi:PAS fold
MASWQARTGHAPASRSKDTEYDGDGQLSTDDDFHVLRVNKEFTRIFGYAAEEVAGHWLPDLIIPEDLRAEALRNRDTTPFARLGGSASSWIFNTSGPVAWKPTTLAVSFATSISRCACDFLETLRCALPLWGYRSFAGTQVPAGLRPRPAKPSRVETPGFAERRKG